MACAIGLAHPQLGLNSRNQMKQLYYYLILWFAVGAPTLSAQVFWTEDFDDAGAEARWDVGGLKPTPPGIPGLTYVPNGPCPNYWIINNASTPINSPAGVIPIGSNWGTSYVGRFTNTANRELCPGYNNASTNRSLHITGAACGSGALLPPEIPDFWDEYTILNDFDGQFDSDQWAHLTVPINTTGRCGVRLRGQFKLGGDANQVISYPSLLYSLDGVNWVVKQNAIGPFMHFTAGACADWLQFTWTDPAWDNQPTLYIAFRWRNDGDMPPIATTADYTLGASVNIDNLVMESVPPPVANFSASPLTVCKNQAVTFTNNTVVYGGMTPVTYTWSIPTAGSSVSNAASFSSVTVVGMNTEYATTNPSLVPAVTFTANGTYTICLRAQNCAGTSTPYCSNIVVEDCRPTADFVGDSLVICATSTPPILPTSPTTVTLFGSASSPYIPCTGGCTAWTWSYTPMAGVTVDSGTVNSQNVRLKFANPGSYTITLTACNNDGCIVVTKDLYITAIDCECTVPVSGGGGPPVTNTLYSANFDGVTLPASGWSVVNLTSPWGNGSFLGISNVWRINNGEAGAPPNTCGFTGGGDQSLHIGATIVSGAAYLSDVNTNRRVQSPVLNPVAAGVVAPLTLEFDFIGNGEGVTDRAYFQYSLDGGTTWVSPTDVPTYSPAAPVTSNLNNLKSTICGSGQGRWTRATWVMPAACATTTQLRLAFVWQSNNNSVGTDPSFAVDDIRITWVSGGGGPVTNNWTGTTSSAWATASNWSSGVPTSTQVVNIPGGTPNQPVISTPITTAAAIPQGITIASNASLTVAAGGALGSATDQVPAIDNDGNFFLTGGSVQAVSVCNQGTITITGNASPSDYQLVVSGFLNNNGAITTTSTDPSPDVVLRDRANPTVSEYLGTGSNIGVDYLVDNAGGGLLTYFRNNFSCRSLTLNGATELGDRTVSLTKDFLHTGGAINTNKLRVRMVGTGASDIANGGNPQVMNSVNPTFAISFLDFYKTSGHTEINSTFIVDNQLRLANAASSYVRVAAGQELRIAVDEPSSVVRLPDFAGAAGGHIVGVLRRPVRDGESYEFPLGNLTSYQRAVLRDNALLSVTSVAGEFRDYATLGAPAPINVPTIDDTPPNPVPYQEWTQGPGYWSFTPNVAPTGGTYDLALHCGPGFIAPSVPYYTFVKGPNGASGPWALGGSLTAFSWPLLFRKNITSFSDFVPIQSLNPLPVEAAPLQAYAQQRSIVVSWQTFKEVNNLGFWLQRTTTPQLEESFSNLSFFPAQGAEGGHYRFLDETAQPGVRYYYRYVQQDFDGAVSYSNIAEAMLAPSGSASNDPYMLAVFPNPFEQRVAFEFVLPEGERVDLAIFDISGRSLHHQHLLAQPGLNRLEWNPTSVYPSGVYLYRLQVGSKVYNGKIVRQ